MPDLLDERQRLTIERMFDSDNQRPTAPAADFTQKKRFRAGNLHQIARFQTEIIRNLREIDPQQVIVPNAEKRILSVTVRQQPNRNLLILLI